MSSSIKVRATICFLAFAILPFLSAEARAQSTSGSATTSWGNYGWQVDQAPVTTTFTSIAGFTTPPGFVQIPVNLSRATTVHEVHGNFSLATWAGGSCGNGSIIAQVLDQDRNAIAAMKLQVFGPGTTNVPITGTFSTPLPVTSLILQYFVDLCGAQTVSVSLVMS